MEPRVHYFNAVAFEENLSMRDLAPHLPGAKATAHEIHLSFAAEGAACGGDVFVYPFGAVAFHDLPAARRDEELARIHRARPGLTTQVVREEFQVREDPAAPAGIADGVLTVDRLTPARAAIVALPLAQSAAMEYYERIVDRLFDRTEQLVDRLERRGTVPVRVRPLHRFIGEAIGIRSEVLQVLHLLDKPDATWDDPAMDHIYTDLRAEFDLVDRYQALESKLRSVQEALELVLDVARDRRLVVLELAIVLLIVFEIVLSLTRGH